MEFEQRSGPLSMIFHECPGEPLFEGGVASEDMEAQGDLGAEPGFGFQIVEGVVGERENERCFIIIKLAGANEI